LGAVVAFLAAFAALDTPALCAEDKSAARVRYEKGTRLYEVREYTEALKEYKAAYVAKADPAFLFNIGQCLRKLDRNAEALDFFQQYLKKIPADHPNRAQVEARIRNIEAGLTAGADPFDQSDTVKAAAPPAVGANPLPAPGPAAPPEPAQQATAPNLLRLPNAPQSAGVDLAASTPAAEGRSSTPIYGTWWFWTGVGAVVVAGAVTAIVLASGGGGASIPSTTLGSRSVP
jgi:tetratricopeptide (TPR) repeat protein